MGRPIKYWILEFEFSEEKKKALDEISAQYHVTYDEIFAAALRQMIEHPAEFVSLHQEYRGKDETDEEIKFIREYPVYEGETEEEARSRALEAEERKTV